MNIKIKWAVPAMVLLNFGCVQSSSKRSLESPIEKNRSSKTLECGLKLVEPTEVAEKMYRIKEALNSIDDFGYPYWDSITVDGNTHLKNNVKEPRFGSLAEESAIMRFNKAWNNLGTKVLDLKTTNDDIILLATKKGLIIGDGRLDRQIDDLPPSMDKENLKALRNYVDAISQEIEGDLKSLEKAQEIVKANKSRKINLPENEWGIEISSANESLKKRRQVIVDQLDAEVKKRFGTKVAGEDFIAQRKGLLADIEATKAQLREVNPKDINDSSYDLEKRLKFLEVEVERMESPANSKPKRTVEYKFNKRQTAVMLGAGAVALSGFIAAGVVGAVLYSQKQNSEVHSLTGCQN